jgi:hypothetical protein
MEVINRRKVMKKTLKGIVLLGALCGGSLHATFQFRSPLSLEDRGYMHWLLAPADQAWWYDMMPSEKTNTPWNIHMWGAGYIRDASRAFAKHESCAGECPAIFCRDKVTRDTASLSQLFFGQNSFVGEQAFPGGTFAGTSAALQELVNGINPFLEFARISPNLTYHEQGANMGIDFARYVGRDDRWHVGGRINIPFKIIEVEQDGSFEEGLDDVVITRIITADEDAVPDNLDYAYRFDFLSSLVFASTLVPLEVVPIVRYNTIPAGTIDITGRRVTGTSVAETTQVPVAYITKNNCGDFPPVPFRKAPSEVAGALGADGEGDNGSTYFFKTGVDYAGNLQKDRMAQSQLFLVPRAVSPGGDILDDSEDIQLHITDLINADLLISEPASTFFLNNGIDLFAGSRVVGIGDLATEFYFGRGHYDDWFIDGIFGLQFPTGKRQKNSNDVYYQTTGNNGHVEVKLELDGGWKPRPWFAFEIRPAFNHAFRRSEKRAAAFEGATVVNIGPEIDVDISWSYFVLRTDFSFFHPHNPDLGFVLGYELFVKGHDHASLCPTTATDFLGQTNQPIAACNYEQNTNSLTNKLRGEIFYRCHYFEIFGGGTQIVSGRNAMKETQGHIGLAIYF